ncbi:MAG: biotin--[acetyl-CoA-carboxylase] ligase [Prevotella sp.]|jgi:BirA family biotin operon repressor/biotin-[acetyl-CoA-carboxylase] ligase|nr:biotin--[acetyl-CoA-carboxylase] ligase [Prevotella sp.]
MFSIIHFTEVDSTNNYLKDLLLKQEVEEGTVVSADVQTTGRGQRGNGWISEKGKNLLFSIVLYPDMVKASEQFVISRIASLAVAEYLLKYVGDITIKWPNDIYWKDKKICGILIENTLTSDIVSRSVIGAGININQTTFGRGAPNAVSLKQITGRTYDLEAMLKVIRNNILLLYFEVRDGNVSGINARYRDLLFRRDGFYLYNDGANDFFARIKDVEPNGMFVLETENGEEKKFAFKEVRYVLS